ncbi:MAG: zinc ribbon domain-containing protein [Chloroflexi bacterium]|nr:zinc ribbon domain-containing protein [Chloroflexota bacterium]
MPIYEYRCGACSRRSSLYFQTFSAAERAEPRCEHCGSADVSRLVSRVAILKSEESRLEDMSMDADLAGVDENDPRSIARWARKMGEQLGEDVGDDFREMVDQLEAGETPDDAPAAGGYGGDDLGGFGGLSGPGRLDASFPAAGPTDEG